MSTSHSDQRASCPNDINTEIANLIESSDHPYSELGSEPPHPADADFPEGYDGSDEPPWAWLYGEDLPTIDRCAAEPQNDTGNGKRLLTNFGNELLHVRDVGWHGWARTHWRASEPERGVQFKEALIKSLTGGEPMLVRSLNKEFFEFRPHFKMVLSGNHKPEIGGVDHGIWRRMKFVLWPVTIPDGEKRQMDDVLEELWAERSGILNWLIEGCLDYLNDGLRTPQEIVDSTASYREEMDPVGAFVGACVVAAPKTTDGLVSTVPARAMYNAYLAWAYANAVRAWKEKSFAMAMSQKGFTKEKHVSGLRYLSVRLENVPDRPSKREDNPSQSADDDAVPV